MTDTDNRRVKTKEYGGIIRTTEEKRFEGYPNRPSPWWKRIFFDNWQLKLLSLFVTILVFYVVQEDKTQVASIDIKLKVKNLPKDVIIVNLDDIPKTVHVKIVGRWSDLAKALQNQKKLSPYYIDLTGVYETTTFHISLRKVKELIGIKQLDIEQVEPSIVYIDVEPREKKKVQVVPKIVGKVSQGYSLDKKAIKVIPEYVIVDGAKPKVDKINKVFTVPIDISNLTKMSRLNVLLETPESDLVKFIPDKVKVVIPISVKSGNRRYRNVEVEVRNCPDDYQCYVRPKRVRVYMKGPEPELIPFDKQGVGGHVYIDASDFDSTQGIYRGLRPVCERPKDVQCVLRPRTITLKFVKNSQEEDDSNQNHQEQSKQGLQNNRSPQKNTNKVKNSPSGKHNSKAQKGENKK